MAAAAAQACAAGAAGVRHRRPALPARAARRGAGRRCGADARVRAHARTGTGHDRAQRRDAGGERSGARAAGAGRTRRRRSRCCPTCTRSTAAGQPFAQRHDLVFVGGFRHPPNVDAVRWFVSEVFPLVARRQPDVALPLHRQRHAGGDRRTGSQAGRRDPRPRARPGAVHGRRRASPWHRCATAPASRARST